MPRPRSVESDTCTFEGCDKPARSKGLCSTHYQAARRGPPTRETGLVRLPGGLRVTPEAAAAVKARAKAEGIEEYRSARLMLEERAEEWAHAQSAKRGSGK